MKHADYYVSPRGDNSNPGTKEQPFASVDRARDAVRELKSRQPASDVRVEIAGGYYLLKETLVFGLEDSGAAGHRIVYEAAEGEKPVFGSGISIGTWSPVSGESTPAEAPEAAKGKLWVADIPEGVDRVLALFDGERRLSRSRGTPFAIPVSRDDVEDMHPRDLAFPPGAMKEYSNLESVECSIIPMHPWTMCILGIESVDLAGNIARMDNRPVYPFAETHHGLTVQVWPENIFEALDGPGKWVSDNQARKVYIWPTEKTPSESIVVPVLRELVCIEGKIDSTANEDTPVRGITLRGLKLIHGQRDTWDQDYQGTGLQHNWEFFDRGNALVRLRGALECQIEDCRLTSSASGGVRLDLHCRRNRVSGCQISDLGGTGILLHGYGPGTKDVNCNNEITDNLIHHIGQDWWHNLGIFVWQSSGNRISHNTIHHCGYTAICVTGRIIFDRSGMGEASKSIRWDEIGEDTDVGDTPESATRWWYRMEKYLHARNNIIENNEIYRVMERLGDGNGIYISGCGGGNVVRKNYIHDIFGTGSNAMIRTDDLQYETLIDSNLVYRCGGPGVYLKHKNDLMNNIFVDLGVEDPEHAYGGKPSFTGFIGLRRAPINGSRIQRNILYCTLGDASIVWEGAMSRPSWGASFLRDCDADNNLYYSPSNPRWADDFLDEKQSEGVEEHSVQTDPRISNPGQRDFSIADDSPALDLGFVRFDLRDVGKRG